MLLVRFILTMSSLLGAHAFASALVIKDDLTRTLTVKAHLIYSGPASTQKIASESTEEIRKMWNAPESLVTLEGKMYQVHFEVDYSLGKSAEKNASCEKNFITIEDKKKEDDRSFYYEVGGNRAVFYTSDELGHSTTAAHEFGHGLHLRHNPLDQTHSDLPGIMYARGTFTKTQFRWDPADPTSTLDPHFRTVRFQDVSDIPFERMTFNAQGEGCLQKGKIKFSMADMEDEIPDQDMLEMSPEKSGYNPAGIKTKIQN